MRKFVFTARHYQQYRDIDNNDDNDNNNNYYNKKMTCSHDYNDNRTSDKQVYMGENQHWTFEIMEYNICANQTSQYKLPQLPST